MGKGKKSKNQDMSRNQVLNFPMKPKAPKRKNSQDQDAAADFEDMFSHPATMFGHPSERAEQPLGISADWCQSRMSQDECMYA